ncbi:hypothetical protein BYT27DRAFT_7201857 [Phlegmacium glaucopus]|nr:hypothetical protein BYT27DRAFT_7201857 [Phlegmacium glaucopus]
MPVTIVEGRSVNASQSTIVTDYDPFLFLVSLTMECPGFRTIFRHTPTTSTFLIGKSSLLKGQHLTTPGNGKYEHKNRVETKLRSQVQQQLWSHR